ELLGDHLIETALLLSTQRLDNTHTPIMNNRCHRVTGNAPSQARWIDLDANARSGRRRQVVQRRPERRPVGPANQEAAGAVATDVDVRMIELSRDLLRTRTGDDREGAERR